MKITSQIKFIGGTLSFIIVMILLSIFYINEKSKSDSIVINIAGKERMLSQKISKEIFLLLRVENSNTYSLKEATEEFNDNLKDLIGGNEKRDIYPPPTKDIKEQLNRVKEIWKDFKINIEKFEKLLNDIEGDKSFIFEKNQKLLKLSDTIVKEMVKENILGNYIDIAGRQRMLSQRMIYHSLLYINTSNPKYYTIFYQSLKIYDETIKKFFNNRELMEITSIKNSITKNLDFWNIYSKKIQKTMEMQREIYKILSYIKEYNIILLDTMDSAVSMYANYSQEQRVLIQKIEYTLGIIALLIMIYSWFLTKNIELNFEKFLGHSKNLTTIIEKEESKSKDECPNNELHQASSHLNNFIKNVGAMILDAQKTIESSEKISQEITQISEMIQKDLKNIQLEEKRKKEIEEFIDNSEDIAIQSIEELQHSSKLLQKLYENLHKLIKEKEKNNLEK